MIQYQGNDNFTDGEIYDLQDPVLGGLGGQSNIPLEALFDRTTWLKNRVFSKDIKTLGGSTTINNTFAGTWIFATSNSQGSTVLQLDGMANFPAGTLLIITCSGNNYITIKPSGSNAINFYSPRNDISVNPLYLYPGETVQILAGINAWCVFNIDGNLIHVGDCSDGYTAKPGTLIRDGRLLNRSAYPRLWNWINTMAGGALVSEGAWQSMVNNIYPYKGCFSSGDGSTTFRLPDDRGCFTRYLDQNRGYDTSRYYQNPGGYEPDGAGPHTHNVRDWYYPGSNGDIQNNGATNYEVLDYKYNNNIGSGRTDTDNLYVLYKDKKTSANSPTNGDGGSAPETVVKNTAKLPLIYY